jgi:hypothetical protein
MQLRGRQGVGGNGLESGHAASIPLTTGNGFDPRFAQGGRRLASNGGEASTNAAARTKESGMKLSLSRLFGAAAALLALAAGTAQARDVHWNVGIHAAPGVTIGVGNSRPLYVAPAPIYVAPAPVYYAPPPAVYYGPRYYAAPAPVYYDRGPRHRHGHRHHHRHRGHRD